MTARDAAGEARAPRGRAGTPGDRGGRLDRRAWLRGAVAATASGLLGGRGAGAGEASAIRIGTHLSATGRMAGAAQRVQRGLTIAVQTFQRARGYPVEVVHHDDESRPEKAAALVEQLVTRDRVVAIVGGYGSHLDGPASEAAERLGVPYVAHFGAISRQFDRRGFKTFFRLAHVSGTVEAEVAFLGSLGVTQVAILHSTEPTAADVASLAREMATAHGITVALFEGFEPRLADWKPLLARVRQAGAPFLVGVGYVQDYLAMVGGCKAVALSVDGVLGAWSFTGVPRRLGLLAENLFGVAYWAPGSAPPPARKEEVTFIGAYARAFEAIPDEPAMGGYVAGRVLLDAAERASRKEGLTPSVVRNELAATDLVTPIGRVAFDAEGSPRTVVNAVIQVHEGRENVVFPPDRAAARAKYPAVPWRT